MIKKLSLILLLAGAQMHAVIDINGKGVNKQALFIGACSTGNHELAKLLIEAGVNVNHETGKSALIWALERNDIEMVRILLNAGANANGMKPGGMPCPLSSARNGEITSLLINAGANVNASGNGQSVLSHAINCLTNIHFQAEEKIKLLLNAGAIVYPTLFNSSEFSCGIPLLSPSLIQLLIKAGLDVNQILNNGYKETFLHSFARRNYKEGVEYLLSLDNINVNLTNCHCKTAFDIACETGNIQIIELFQNYFAAQEAKALRGNEQQATNTSVINIANNSNGHLNVLHQVEVPAHSKAEVTTVISKI